MRNKERKKFQTFLKKILFIGIGGIFGIFHE
jgi:hypothetical protein